MPDSFRRTGNIEISRCVTINILNYNVLPNEQYHNVYHLREEKDRHELLGGATDERAGNKESYGYTAIFESG